MKNLLPGMDENLKMDLERTKVLENTTKNGRKVGVMGPKNVSTLQACGGVVTY